MFVFVIFFIAIILIVVFFFKENFNCIFDQKIDYFHSFYLLVNLKIIVLETIINNSKF
jgi:hypothetical protein